MEVFSSFAQFGPLGILLGISLGFNIFIIIEFVRGTWTSRKNLDQVQKISDQYQQAWEKAMENQAKSTDILSRLTVVADTIEHFIKSMPGGRN